jgi:hypothetical protein
MTFANVVSSIALFVALGGSAYALLPSNSVGTSQLKDGAVTNTKLAAGAVTGAKVATNSLTGQQIDAATLGTVPRAGHASTAEKATNADHLGGQPALAYQARVLGKCANHTAITKINTDGTVGCAAAYPTVLPSGSTETGTYAVRWPAGASGESEDAVVSFPVPLAAAPLGSDCAEACLDGGPVPGDTVDCPGTVTAPKANPGYFCFYPAMSVNVFALSSSDPSGTEAGVGALGGEITVGSSSSGDTIARGTWAVTAP